ncbi:enoyl-CoA hydratase/isomerase family protein [Fusibacter paucivorans]|uniref:Enoyl-CoA hydratase/isomerase family protein n=1 Tax=Fusibacter paucivorans TaxID=76009 RepID=A0ABS5PRZ0_9FIRM|nr:enoyl-CoA hydratase-related protein [Fusibacter paucivorans]MBS7527667.1 enoyl-CoA hydratase/isomerase family protein [Fusibacter paucivorans]
MQYSSVIVSKKDNIGIVTLNRPEQHNTFNVPLATELNQALIELESDQAVNVIVINANGANFCTGIDVNDLEGKSNKEYLEWVTLMEQMNVTIASMGKPVIASVHKIAVANGIGLVAACDLAIAAENAKFGATAVNVGLFCMGPAVPLLKSLGRKKTLELIMTGELIDAHEAQRIGLVNKVVPTEKLAEETMAFAAKLAKKSPLALQLGKQSFYKMEDLNYTAALDLTNNHFATLCTTEDAHEGVNAFLNKREPVWQKK